jgi:hypothetical protein
MCGPWLIFVPFAGIFVALLIYDSNWRRPRKRTYKQAFTRLRGSVDCFLDRS